jgi:hypothetical protein
MSKQTTRRLTGSYLTTEGTMYQIFEELRGGSRIGETTDVTYGYAKVEIVRYLSDEHNREFVQGRIVIHRYSNDGFIALAKGGRVSAVAPGFYYGSERTREQRLETQSVKLITKGNLELSWHDVVSVMGSTFTVQVTASRENPEQYAIPEGLTTGDRLHDTVVNKVTDLRKPKEVAA